VSLAFSSTSTKRLTAKKKRHGAMDPLAATVTQQASGPPVGSVLALESTSEPGSVDEITLDAVCCCCFVVLGEITLDAVCCFVVLGEITLDAVCCFVVLGEITLDAVCCCCFVVLGEITLDAVCCYCFVVLGEIALDAVCCSVVLGEITLDACASFFVSLGSRAGVGVGG
jgi:6,7-dimethyl-8-ribityllumazine synthase